MKLKEYFKSIQKFDLFNLGISSIVVLAIIYLYLPVFSFLNLNVSMAKGNSQLVTLKAFLYSLAGMGCFVLGYWGLNKKNRIGSNGSCFFEKIFNAEWNDFNAAVVFFSVFSLGFLSKIYRIITGTYLLHQYINKESPLFIVKFFMSLNIFHFIALAVAFVYYYDLLNKKSPNVNKWKFIAWGTFAFEVICGLITSGGKLAAVTPILICLLSRHYIYKKSNLKIVGAAILVLFMILPIKNFLREPASAINNYFGKGKTIIVDKKLDFVDMVLANKGQSVSNAKNTNIQNSSIEKHDIVLLIPKFSQMVVFSADSTIGRLAQSHIFSLIVEKTEKFHYGSDWLYILRIFGIPNDVVKKISGVDDGSNFGVKYGITDNNMTGIDYTVMGDLYLNFGLTGILVGMLLIGYGYRKIFDFFVKSDSNTAIFMYCIFWIWLMYGFEMSLVNTFSKIIQLFLIFLLINYYFKIITIASKYSLKHFDDFRSMLIARKGFRD